MQRDFFSLLNTVSCVNPIIVFSEASDLLLRAIASVYFTLWVCHCKPSDVACARYLACVFFVSISQYFVKAHKLLIERNERDEELSVGDLLFKNQKLNCCFLRGMIWKDISCWKVWVAKSTTENLTTDIRRPHHELSGQISEDANCWHKLYKTHKIQTHSEGLFLDRTSLFHKIHCFYLFAIIIPLTQIKRSDFEMYLKNEFWISASIFCKADQCRTLEWLSKLIRPHSNIVDENSLEGTTS